MTFNDLHKTFTMAFTMALLAGCGDMHDSHAEHATGQPHAEAATTQLQLDHGAKWRLDEHTRTQFQIMQERVSSAAASKELGSKLQQDVDQVIAGCTMTGEAHQQLHLFLAQLLPAVTALKETGDAAAASQVQALLVQFPQYFE